MRHAQQSSAIEQAIATIVAQFGRVPDRYFSNDDLHSGFCRMLQEDSLLDELAVTRDERHTQIVHLHYPNFASTGPSGAANPSQFDVAILNPSFVRGHPWDTVTNHQGQAAAHWQHLDSRDRPVPLLAALYLRLLPCFSPQSLASLEDCLIELDQAAPASERRYLAVFCRHWDLDRQLASAIPLFEHWAARYPQVSLVISQAFLDRMGRVWAGRYFNRWSHTAPLPPLQLAGQGYPRTSWHRS